MENGRETKKHHPLFLLLSYIYSFLFYSSFNGLTTNLEPLKLAVEGQEEGKYRQSEFPGEWGKRGEGRERERGTRLEETAGS